MPMFTFHMSCGHTQEIEVADPKKYLAIDKAYYEKQGLCDACWAELHRKHKIFDERRRRKSDADFTYQKEMV
jgi:hypothetical protein